MSLLKPVSKHLTVTHDNYDLEGAIAMCHFIDTTDSPGVDPVYRFEYSGTGDEVEINAGLCELLGDPILTQEQKADKSHYYDYANDKMYVRFFFNRGKKNNESGEVQLRGVTTSLLFYEKIKALSSFIKVTKDSNAVYALMSNTDGLSLRSIGKINHDLVEANYSKEAVDGYKHIVSCLSSEDPCGRLALLQGPPGTGKSYMIRSLVSNVRSTFIIVGAHMIPDLAGPSILPVIMGCVNADDKKPITFILEDADIALSHRKNGGVSELSGLLNLGDGLLGEMLDIRIIATTNAELLNLDPAVVRPGRMCQRILLNSFSASDADTLYASMVKDKTVNLRKATTLAEIYRMAREDGWAPQTAEKLKDGQYL